MDDLQNRIIVAATGLFLENGPRTVTMDQVSEHCGISKRTLYEQFTDKNRLLCQCLNLLNQEQIAMRENLRDASTNVIDYLIQSMRQTIEASLRFNPEFFEELQKYYPQAADFQAQASTEIMNRELTGIIQAGIDQGIFRKETHINAVTQLLKVQLDALYYSDLLPANNLQLSEVFHTLIFTFMRGIATETGLQIIAGFEAN